MDSEEGKITDFKLRLVNATTASKHIESTKKKTKNYSKEKWAEVNDGLMTIFDEFAVCKSNDESPDSAEAHVLVAKLQAHITANYYTCTDEILTGLGQMYIADERFKKNIDKYDDGTAEFVSKAIAVFC